MIVGSTTLNNKHRFIGLFIFIISTEIGLSSEDSPHEFMVILLLSLEPGDLLGPSAEDIIKSFDIVLAHKGWKWCNNYLVGDHLWNIFRKWSQQQLPKCTIDDDRIHDATVVTSIRLIGEYDTWFSIILHWLIG